MTEAVIFDMDGVISDTQKLHSQVESGLLTSAGIIITPDEITRKYSGVITEHFFKDLLQDRLSITEIESLLHQKWQKMLELAKIGIDPIQGALSLITNLSESKIPLGLASASPKDFVNIVLSCLSIESYFKVVTSGDQVKNGKPDPEIFLLTASRLGIDPGNCIVIEDGISGMKGAKAAGMKCIGLVKSISDIYPADIQVLSLEGLTVEYILSL